MMNTPRTPENDQTLVLIKPDALKNSLTGYVLSQLSAFHTGLRLAGSKVVFVPRLLAEEHYVEHRNKLFFPSLIDYLRGVLHYPGEPRLQRVVAIVYQGTDAVKMVRGLVGPTNPHTAREKDPGSIRSLGAVMTLKDADGKEIGQQIDNLIHASATNAEAEREIKLWFKPCDIPPHMRIYPTHRCTSRFYYKNGTLLTRYEDGAVCMMAEGDVAWASDLAALAAIQAGQPSDTTLTGVVAKYLINEIEAGEEETQD
jgi:nucleoside-diphosphate kinase